MHDEHPVDFDVAVCLADAYGVEPPRFVLEVAQSAFAHATRDGFVNDTDYLSFEGARFDLAGLALRPVWPHCEPHSYPSTPPELFVFGAPGVDGIHYGFIVHVPGRAPYPLAAFNPMTPECGVRALGAALPSQRLASTPVFDPNWPAIEPVVPPGWRYRPSSDGVGVLAPAEAFGALPSVDVNCLNTVSQVEDAATLALQQGYPATGLWILREFIANCDAASAGTALRLMAQTYRALARPLLADAALAHAQRYWPQAQS